MSNRQRLDSLVPRGIFLLGPSFSADSLSVSVQPPVVVCINTCVHKKTQALVAMPLFGHTKIQHSAGQPLTVEDGSPSGRGMGNSHTRNLSPQNRCTFSTQKGPWKKKSPHGLKCFHTNTVGYLLLSFCWT